MDTMPLEGKSSKEHLHQDMKYMEAKRQLISSDYRTKLNLGELAGHLKVLKSL